MEELKKKVAYNSEKIKQFDEISTKLVDALNGYSTAELKQGITMIVEIGRIFYVTKEFKWIVFTFLGLFIGSFFGIDYQFILKLLKIL